MLKHSLGKIWRGLWLNLWLLFIAVTIASQAGFAAQEPVMTVTLLGTGSPIPSVKRFGPATLIEAGGKTVLVDAGRGAATRLWQLGIPLSTIDAIFLTHLHSDHLVGLDDLALTGWIKFPAGGRQNPLRLFGPAGVKELAAALNAAFEVDRTIRIVDEKLPPFGSTLEAAVYKAGEDVRVDDITILPIEVDHGDNIKPAFGFKISFKGLSVALSGDTRYSAAFAGSVAGADLLVHEVAAADPSELKKSKQMRRIIGHHTVPADIAMVIEKSKPRLTVLSHIVLLPPNAPSEAQVLKAIGIPVHGDLRMGQDLDRFLVSKAEIKYIAY